MHTALQPVGAEQVAAGGAPTAAAASPNLTRVAIAGATGYAGQELLRLLARHPLVRVTAAMSSGATASGRRLPALARIWNGDIQPLSADSLARDVDVVFLALPDRAAAELAPGLVDDGVRVIDLSGAFRLNDAAERTRWYPETHHLPDDVAYGLTEHEGDAIARARLVANPGCYPTAALLALTPAIASGLIVPGSDIVVDAKSGVSGAGKTPSDRTHFSECHGSVSAYGVFDHRHAAEIEQRVDGRVTFVPHLVPLDRGLLATIYVRLKPDTTSDAVAAVYERAYAGATFVRPVGASLPEIKHVVRTNFCDIGWKTDVSGRAVLVSVIDNLVKGAAGQAVQNMNVMLGLDERTGLL